MQRRFSSRRPMLVQRRKPHWLWVRANTNDPTSIPVTTHRTFDLLANYRTLAGIDLNLPEFTIWRVRIKVNVKFNLAIAQPTFEPSDGILVAMYVDDMADNGTNPVVSVYHEHYLIYEEIFAYKMLQEGANGGQLTPQVATAAIPLYREFDVKSHRRITNIGETLQLQLAAFGNGVIQTSALSYSILVLQRS